MGSCRRVLGAGQRGCQTPAGWGARPGWLAHGGHGGTPAILLRFPSRGYPRGHRAGGRGEDEQEDAPLLSRCGAEERRGGEGKGIPVLLGLCRARPARWGHPDRARGWGWLGDGPTCHSGAARPAAPGSASPRGCGAGAVALPTARGWPGSRSWRCVGRGGCGGHGPAGSAAWARGGIRAACPPLPSPGISCGQRGAGSRQLPWGRKPGYFGGCGGGAVGWHCPCRVTPPGPALPRCRDGTSGPVLCWLAALSPWSAMRRGTPRRGGDATSLGGPPGTVWHGRTRGVWLPSKGLP